MGSNTQTRLTELCHEIRVITNGQRLLFIFGLRGTFQQTTILLYFCQTKKTAWRSYRSTISRYVLSSLSSVVGDDRETVGDLDQTWFLDRSSHKNRSKK